MVQALDAARAQHIARAQHPTGRLSAVPAELPDGQDRHQLVTTWIMAEGRAELRGSIQSSIRIQTRLSTTACAPLAEAFLQMELRRFS